MKKNFKQTNEEEEWSCVFMFINYVVVIVVNIYRRYVWSTYHNSPREPAILLENVMHGDERLMCMCLGRNYITRHKKEMA